MTNVSPITSRNGKLNTNMTLESVKEASYKSEKEKNKAISLFEKADKNKDGMLDESEIKAYDKKQTLKKVAIGAVIALGAVAIGAVIAKGAGLFRSHVKSALPELTKTIDANAALSEFDQVRACTNLDGRAFISDIEISNLLENCQKGFITDGKPIPKYLEKIVAVMNNPEEVASISGWKSRSAGIWRAIQDPLESTVKMNPGLF